MIIQKMIIDSVVRLLKKQFKLDKILKYVEKPNELDKKVENIENRLDLIELLLKKEK